MTTILVTVCLMVDGQLRQQATASGNISEAPDRLTFGELKHTAQAMLATMPEPDMVESSNVPPERRQ